MSAQPWFVKNVSDGPWVGTEKFGQVNVFEGADKFKQIGVNIHIVAPRQPACLYHRENQQEDFLVLSGTCRVLIDEQDIPLKTWDFVHCEPGVNHVFVGGDNGPCAILMIGARSPNKELTYPVSELARSHGASVDIEAHNPREAYANCGEWKQFDVDWPI